MIPVLTILVVQGGVPVEEGAATDIFAGNTDTVTGNQQRSVGQVLGHPPVDRELALAHQATVVDDLLDPAVQREILGDCRQPLGQALQLADRHLGIAVLDVSSATGTGVQSMVIGCL
jgi:hypothetical protein